MSKVQKNIKQTLKKDLQNKKAWIPNSITMLRLFGPIIIPKMAFSKKALGTLGATALLALTDFADGKIARKLNAETELGAKLDPIVDKVFALGLLGQAIPSNPAMTVPLILEGIIATINTTSLINGGAPKSNQIGRLKMWPLSAAIISEYLAIASEKPQLKTAANACLIGSTVLEGINIFEYYKAAKDDQDKKESHETINIIEPNYNENITQEKVKTLTLKTPVQITYQNKQYIRY